MYARENRAYLRSLSGAKDIVRSIEVPPAEISKSESSYVPPESSRLPPITSYGDDT
jgi:hypothetical protein